MTRAYRDELRTALAKDSSLTPDGTYAIPIGDITTLDRLYSSIADAEAEDVFVIFVVAISKADLAPPGISVSSSCPRTQWIMCILF